MLSKFFSILAFMAFGCGAPNNSRKGIIGETLKDKTPLYNVNGIRSNLVYLVDKPTKRVMEIDLEKMSVVQNHNMAHPDDDHTLASSLDGSYFIDFSEKHLDIVGKNGTTQRTPFPFQGMPTSAAFNPSAGIFIMEDSLQSVGMMMLSSDGTVTKSWLGGPVLASGTAINAGDIDGKGRLVLAGSDNSIAVADVEKSIDAGSWQFEKFDSTLKNINWVAPDHAFDSLSLVVSQDAIAVVDIDAKALKDQAALTAGQYWIVGESKREKPHVIVNDITSSTLKLYYIGSDGKLVTQPLPSTTVTGYSESNLDSGGTQLTVMTNDAANGVVVSGIRLTDSLVTANLHMASTGDVALGIDKILVNKNATLGHIETHAISDGGIRVLEGYNLKYFQGN